MPPPLVKGRHGRRLPSYVKSGLGYVKSKLSYVKTRQKYISRR